MVPHAVASSGQKLLCVGGGTESAPLHCSHSAVEWLVLDSYQLSACWLEARQPKVARLVVCWRHPGYLTCLAAMLLAQSSQHWPCLDGVAVRCWRYLRGGKQQHGHGGPRLLTVVAVGPIYSTQPFMASCIAWQARLQPLVRARQQLVATGLWLSTLGGAYSALGDANPDHARRAGALALRQLKLAQCMGDEVLARQCLLFTAYALMQLGALKAARAVIQAVWAYARTSTNTKLRESTRNAWRQLRVRRQLHHGQRGRSVAAT